MTAITKQQLFESIKNCLINKQVTRLCELVVDIFGKALIIPAMNMIIDEYIGFYITFNAHLIEKMGELLRLIHQANDLKTKKRPLCNTRVVRIAVTQLMVILCNSERSDNVNKYKLSKTQSIIYNDQTPSFFHLTLNTYRTNNIDFYNELLMVFNISPACTELIHKLLYNGYCTHDLSNVNILLSQIHSDQSIRDSINIKHGITVSDISVFKNLNCDLQQVPGYILLLLYVLLCLSIGQTRYDVLRNMLYMYLFDFKKTVINKRYNLLLQAYVISCSPSIDSLVYYKNIINPIVYECSLKIHYLFINRIDDYKNLEECCDDDANKNESEINKELYLKALFTLPHVDLEAQRRARQCRMNLKNRIHDCYNKRVVDIQGYKDTSSRNYLTITKKQTN